MASPNDQPWTDADKNYLLAEIIKQHNPPPRILMNFVTELGIQIRWNDLALPPGRSLNACFAAFGELSRPQPISSYPSAYPMQPPTPQAPGIKRSYPFDQPAAMQYNHPRIAPRPQPTGSGPSQSQSIEEPTKKPRGRPPGRGNRPGRPSKSATLARATEGGPSRLGDSSLSAIPAARPTSSTSNIVTPTTEAATPFQPRAELPRSDLPPSSRMPISSMITPNAPSAKSQSSSSSGKKRRKRSTRAGSEEPQDGGPAADNTENFTSPYVIRRLYLEPDATASTPRQLAAARRQTPTAKDSDAPEPVQSEAEAQGK